MIWHLMPWPLKLAALAVMLGLVATLLSQVLWMVGVRQCPRCELTIAKQAARFCKRCGADLPWVRTRAARFH